MNMKFAAVTALAMASLAAFATPAAATDNGFYLGAGVTSTKFDVKDFGSSSLDGNSFKVIAGYRPLDWLAAEANYIDLGSDSNNGASVSGKAFTVSGLLIANIAIVDLYARAGMANWNFDGSFNGIKSSENGWEPTYGAGVGLHFGRFGARAEYETFHASDLDTHVNTFSVSFLYTFQ
jgi:OOP family OmpA-OmpF porin